MVIFNGITKTYPTSDGGVRDINLHIKAGEFVSIIGHSGAGKTTLLKLLLGEEKPSEGELLFDGQNVHRLKRGRLNILRRQMGSIFQDFRLLANKTAYENIAFVMEAADRSNEDILEDVPYVLDLVGLSGKEYSFPHELSGGEQQRVAIARAIVNRPDLIIADEPTGNLDPVNTYDVIQILKKINDLGATVILTTHNKGVVDEIGKRVVLMEGGRIVSDEKHGSYTV